jgi:hypothetical protein
VTSKILNEVQYSWRTFLKVVEFVLQRAVKKLKLASLKKTQKTEEDENIGATRDQVEVEIGETFFREKVLPSTHKLMMSNVKLESVSTFNMVLALRFALLFETITNKEYNYMLQQFVKLPDFYRWREGDHEFVDLNQTVTTSHLSDIKAALMLLDHELTRKVFSYVEKRLGKTFTYQQASPVFSEDIPKEFGLSPIQSLLFGFVCPDHEFKARITLFMYQQL